MSLNGKNVLVTGAGGFIGSHLSEVLVQAGASVRAFVRYSSSGGSGWLDSSEYESEIEILRGDITDRDSVEAAVQGTDIVFNLAALIGIPYSYEAPRAYVDVNVSGGLNVFQAALAAGVERVVQTSTSEVYGTAISIPIDESHPLQPQSPYSASKISADVLAQSFHNSFDLPVVIFRPFNTYGPRQSQRAIIPTVIKQCLDGDTVELGNVHPTRDLVYVADTVSGFTAASLAENISGEIVHVGTGVDTSIGDLAKLIGKLMGKEITINSDSQRVRPADSEVERLLADPSKAQNLLGWSASTDLETGLSKTIDWFKSNPGALDRSGYVV